MYVPSIVGGGVSGVYNVWRFKQADPQRQIVVFEGGGDVGGSLLSVRPPDIPNMVAELGGMRILRASPARAASAAKPIVSASMPAATARY